MIMRLLHEMIRHFSQDTLLNPNGWVGETGKIVAMILYHISLSFLIQTISGQGRRF